MIQNQLFEYKPGINWTKEKALRMVTDGRPDEEICIELNISLSTLEAWVRSGLPSGRGGDPDLDQLSLYDGLSQRERQ